MTYALSSGITGLEAHQKMLDVAGNNLANVNTTAFKASRITFEELLSQTLEEGSEPTERVGGTNPEQVGCGVGVAGITPDTEQGSIVNTGSPLDMAIEGLGYFVVSDGEHALYTRAGAFGVDAGSHLVDPATGYRVQRIGLTGEADGFQVAGDSNIRVPYGVALPAKATSEISVSGNLSSDAVDVSRAQVMTSSLRYTYDGDRDALETTELDLVNEFSGGSAPDGQLDVGETGTITISGFNPDGSALSSGLSFTVTPTTTLGDLLTHLNTNVLNGATASLVNGRIRITDDQTGYSKSDISLSYSGAGTLQMPPYFEVTTVGGDQAKNVNITIYDSQGGKHVLCAALVRTDTVNTWDMVLTSVTGNVGHISPEDRRINNLTFNAQTGAFDGVPLTEKVEFAITFDHDLSHAQTIAMNLGTMGTFDGLTQFAGSSTAVAREQDGYEAGNLSAVSVNDEGVLIGAFSNGIKKDIAALQIGLFSNPAGLEAVGGGYFAPSANSGAAVAIQAMRSGAGSIHGGALEKSNADVATEFVNMIQAQNGFQASARTIRVATDILRELTSLIR
jgi:flagellar hook protein FlgE